MPTAMQAIMLRQTIDGVTRYVTASDENTLAMEVSGIHTLVNTDFSKNSNGGKVYISISLTMFSHP